MKEQILQLLQNPLVILIVVLVIFALITWLVKSLIKGAIIVIIFYVCFKIIFVWTPDEFTNNLHIDKILKPDAAEKVIDGYKDFYDKREENNIINTDYIDEKLEEGKTKTENTVSDVFENLKLGNKDNNNNNNQTENSK